MKYYLNTVFVLVLLCFSLSSKKVCAQLIQDKEIKIPIDIDKVDDFSVHALKEDGVIILNSQKTFYSRKSLINVFKYDSTLNFIWKTTFEPGDNFNLEKYFIGETHFYCLFKEVDKEDIKILKIDLNTGFGVISEAKMLTRMDINFFTAIDNKIVIGGSYNNRPVVELCRLFDGNAKVLPHVHSNYVAISGIEVNEATKELYVMLRDEKKCSFIFSVYDYEGKLIKTEELGDKDRSILNGKVLKIKTGELFLAGNFATSCSAYSSGFYFYPLLGEGGIQYYKFSDLQNFFSYLPEKRKSKVLSRLEKRRSKGKKDNLKYRLNMHEPIVDNREIDLVAEVYYPEYKSNTNIVRTNLYDLRNNMPFYKEYNNYKFTHALLCVFDFEGKKAWDFSFDMGNLESSILNEKIQLTKIGENYMVAFPKDELIKSMTVSRNNEVLENNTLDMRYKDGEKVVSDISVELSAWYGQKYLAFGEKSQKNDGGYLSKVYFYVSRLTYQVPELRKTSELTK